MSLSINTTESFKINLNNFPFWEDADLIDSFNARAKQIEALIQLSVRSCGLTSRSIELFTASYRFKDVITLDLEDNSIGDEGTLVLSQYLKDLKHLEYLNLSNCEIGPKGAHTLAHFINTTTIKRLHLNGNKLNDEGMYYFYDTLIKNNSTLCELELKNCNITKEYCDIVTRTLNYHNKTLTTINLSENP